MKKSYLYTNNHFASKSVVNAVMLKAQLGQPIEGEYPATLIERYPEIRGPGDGGHAVNVTCMRPVTFSALATARQVAGLRPFRPTGFRVETERIGLDTVAHARRRCPVGGGLLLPLVIGGVEFGNQLGLEPRRPG